MKQLLPTSTAASIGSGLTRVCGWLWPLFPAKYLAAACLLLVLSSTALASHFKGGQITYQYMGDGQYDIIIKGYWDYRAVGTVYPRYDGNPAIHDAPLTVSKTLLPDGKTMEHVQRQQVTWFTPGTYRVYWMTCCRSVGSNFNNNENGLFTVIHYDPAAPSSSPQFYDLPIFNYTAGRPVNYTINMEDPDGHGQEYSLEIPYGLPADVYKKMEENGFQVMLDGTVLWDNPLPGLWLVNVKLQEKINGTYSGAYITREFLMNVSQPGGNTPPVISLMPAITVKEGQSLTFEVEASDAEGGQVALVSSGTVYGKGAAFAQAVYGSVARGTFSWTPPRGAAGTYQVQFIATDNSATPMSSQVNVLITVEACPVFAATATVVAQPCQGGTNGSIALGTTGPGVGPFLYSLDNGKTFQEASVFESLPAGQYTAVVRDISGCHSERVQVVLNEVPLPEVALDMPAQSFCVNAGPVVLSGGSPAGGDYHGTGVENGALYPDRLGAGSHTIFYTFTDGNGCSSTASTLISVADAPIAEAGADTVVYIGYPEQRCTELRAGVTGGKAPYSYHWSTGETEEFIKVCPDTTTTYTLTVTDALGCASSSKVTVTVYDVRCGSTSDKVMICHKGKTLCVDPAVAKDHFAHGDELGDCSVAPASAMSQQMAAEVEVRPDAGAEVQVFPNPVTLDSQVKINVKEEGTVLVELVNLSGNQVKTLYEGYVKAGQNLSVNIGKSLSGNGVYVGRVVTANGVQYFKVAKY